MLFSRRQLPNLITGLRIVLVVPIAWTLAQLRFEATIVLFGVAAMSDAADGFLAKRFGWQSDLGAALDPIADKLLLATVFVTLAYLGLSPWWLMAVAVARDLIIVLGAIAYRVCIGPIQGHPSTVSKLNTLAQVAFILAVIARQRYELPPPWLLTALGATVFLTVVVSGIDYVVTYGRRALQPAAGP
jgi:cardiolipin synthase (CMP-forming)